MVAALETAPQAAELGTAFQAREQRAEPETAGLEVALGTAGLEPKQRAELETAGLEPKQRAELETAGLEVAL